MSISPMGSGSSSISPFGSGSGDASSALQSMGIDPSNSGSLSDSDIDKIYQAVQSGQISLSSLKSQYPEIYQQLISEHPELQSNAMGSLGALSSLGNYCGCALGSSNMGNV